MTQSLPSSCLQSSSRAGQIIGILSTTVLKVYSRGEHPGGALNSALSQG